MTYDEMINAVADNIDGIMDATLILRGNHE